MIFINRYKLYSVHINPEHENPYETAEFIAEGFNFYAFVFQALWLLYNRIWIAGLIIASLMIFIIGMGGNLDFNPISVLVLRFGIQIMIGFQANDLLRNSLDDKGYVMAGIASGSSLIEAQQRFFDIHFSKAKI